MTDRRENWPSGVSRTATANAYVRACVRQNLVERHFLEREINSGGVEPAREGSTSDYLGLADSRLNLQPSHRQTGGWRSAGYEEERLLGSLPGDGNAGGTSPPPSFQNEEQTVVLFQRGRPSPI